MSIICQSCEEEKNKLREENERLKNMIADKNDTDLWKSHLEMMNLKDKEIQSLRLRLARMEEAIKTARASIGIWYDAYLQLIDGVEEGAPDIPALALSQQKHALEIINKALEEDSHES